jgi:hypothetical protein
LNNLENWMIQEPLRLFRMQSHPAGRIILANGKMKWHPITMPARMIIPSHKHTHTQTHTHTHKLLCLTLICILMRSTTTALKLTLIMTIVRSLLRGGSMTRNIATVLWTSQLETLQKSQLKCLLIRMGAKPLIQ